MLYDEECSERGAAFSRINLTRHNSCPHTYKECKDEMGNLVGRMKIDKSMQTEEKICRKVFKANFSHSSSK